jgi:signal transduction histidine kinase
VSGSGIGLTNVKKIIETHGGSIWVDSEVGKGTTFYFDIPLPPTKV